MSRLEQACTAISREVYPIGGHANLQHPLWKVIGVDWGTDMHRQRRRASRAARQSRKQRRGWA